MLEIHSSIVPVPPAILRVEASMPGRGQRHTQSNPLADPA
ncbi:MAG: hypothetical protein JWN04_5878 [Myxococcaceae bacterium]|nr:hypothetical protein [Myxococcaceae bacterium]